MKAKDRQSSRCHPLAVIHDERPDALRTFVKLNPAPVRDRFSPVRLHRPVTVSSYLQDPVIPSIGYKAPIGRDKFHKGPELVLNPFHTAVNVRVVELTGCYHGYLRVVMKKFGPLVKISGVVLIPLDHEQRAAAQTVIPFEILRHSSNHEARITLFLVKDPGDHGADRSFAVRPRDDYTGLIAYKVSVQCPRHGGEGNAGPFKLDRFRIGLPDYIADNH